MHSPVSLPHLGELCLCLQVIGIELLAQSLLPAVKDLAEDKHWRVRLAIVEHIPLLASQLGPDFFQEKLGPQCMKSLEDQVASIRDATAKTLQKIAQDFGAEWSKEHLVPQVGRETGTHSMLIVWMTF